VADAQYVLRWSAGLAQAVLNGTMWVSEAIHYCKPIEEAARALGLESEEEVQEVLRCLEAERAKT